MLNGVNEWTIDFHFNWRWRRRAESCASHHRHGGRTFVFFGDPFYDPFYYSYIPPSIPYPAKIVSFASGRVVSFQYLAPPY